MLDVVDADILFSGNTEVTSMSLGLVDHLRQIADLVLGEAELPEGSLVIDIGSNDGTLLRFFQARGMRVLGVDPSGFIAQKANDSGIPTLRDYFTADVAQRIRSEHGPAKIVMANRVIANVDNLPDMIEGIRCLLAPDGMFYFETGYLVDILQNLLFDTIYHEHLGYDLAKPLAALFPRHGLELIDIERVGVKGGSLRGKVQHSSGQRAVNPAVAELIAMEERIGLHRAEGYRSFNESLAIGKRELNDFLNKIQSKNQPIAGYGASVGSTTETYYFDLGNVLSFFVDDDPRNQNLFSPGYHIPVMPSQAIYDEKADYVVILAWRYSEPIIRKHQAFLERGGHFIIPLPEVRVV